MSQKRALLVRAGALGDVLLLRASLHALRAGGWAVTLLVPARSGSVLRGPGEAEALIDWERADVAALLAAGPPPPALCALLAGFEAAVVYSRQVALAEALRAIVPRVVAHDPAPPADTHAAAWLWQGVRALGAPAVEMPAPLLFTGDEARAAGSLVERLPPRFLAVHPGSGSPAKNWPAPRFAALAAALAGGQPFLAIAGPADGAGTALLGAVPGARVAGELPPRVLGALLQRAGLYVGNDSGVTHLAAAAGARTLALFGPTDPAQWTPVGRAVRTMGAASGAMEDLTLEAVRDAVRRWDDEAATP